MLAGMSSRQFSEWMAYAAVEPFGEERDDYRLAHGLAVIVNLFRGKNDQPVRLVDLLPKVGVLADETGASSLAETPAIHPNVQRFEAMMEHLQWAQSQT
jgi:hypothetical protein